MTHAVERLFHTVHDADVEGLMLVGVCQRCSIEVAVSSALYLHANTCSKSNKACGSKASRKAPVHVQNEIVLSMSMSITILAWLK